MGDLCAVTLGLLQLCVDDLRQEQPAETNMALVPQLASVLGQTLMMCPLMGNVHHTLITSLHTDRWRSMSGCQRLPLTPPHYYPVIIIIIQLWNSSLTCLWVLYTYLLLCIHQ